MDAAREPQMTMIAASSPSAATKDALKDAIKVPSAQSYFNDTHRNRRSHPVKCLSVNLKWEDAMPIPPT